MDHVSPDSQPLHPDVANVKNQVTLLRVEADRLQNLKAAEENEISRLVARKEEAGKQVGEVTKELTSLKVERSGLMEENEQLRHDKMVLIDDCTKASKEKQVVDEEISVARRKLQEDQDRFEQDKKAFSAKVADFVHEEEKIVRKKSILSQALLDLTNAD